MALRALFVDFNSYFASVEQHLRPELRGRPVGVVPMLADSTCCIAASYEAKAFGVKTGTIVADARRMCPGIVLVEARHAEYVRWHKCLVELVESCLHVDEVMSIDEMVCYLDGRLRDRAEAEAMALKIKRVIAEQAGPTLRCSIGIAPNTFLAKTASDMQKPDGLVIIERTDLPHILHPLTLRDLCGIGRRMEERLRAYGITTVRQLCAARKETLREVWGGIEGGRFHAAMRGDPVWRPPTRHTTVGHSHVLPPELRDESGARSVLSRLLQKAAMRLRHMGMTSALLGVSIKYTGGKRWGRDVRIEPTQDTLTFLRALHLALDQRPQHLVREKPVAVSVSLFHLASLDAFTPSLFDPTGRRHRLHHAIDRLNQKFGRTKVHYGGAHEARDSAPMRIAFTHIPDLDIESDDIDGDDGN